jgi:hypothetical protein
MKIKNTKSAPILFLAICLSAAQLIQASVIVNGDFESTTASGTVPDGWIGSGGNPTNPAAYQNDTAVPPASGMWALDLGPAGSDGANGGSIAQTFSVTVVDSYTFSFKYSNELNDPIYFADFSWSLSGAVNDSGTFLNIGGGYATFSRTYLIAAPGDITVTFSDIVGRGDKYDAIIDDVSFALVPEPEAAMLIGLGCLCGVILWRAKGVRRVR